MKALIRTSTTRRPNSGEVIGVRLQACVPNNAGRKMIPTDKGIIATKKEVPSFRKPYFILESMDYADHGQVTEAEIERFKQRLKWEGFAEFEFLNADKPSSQKMTAETKAKIDALFTGDSDDAPF